MPFESPRAMQPEKELRVDAMKLIGKECISLAENSPFRNFSFAGGYCVRELELELGISGFLDGKWGISIVELTFMHNLPQVFGGNSKPAFYFTLNANFVVSLIWNLRGWIFATILPALIWMMKVRLCSRQTVLIKRSHLTKIRYVIMLITYGSN